MSNRKYAGYYAHTTKETIKKKAIKLFAQGYRPYKLSMYCYVGTYNMELIIKHHACISNDSKLTAENFKNYAGKTFFMSHQRMVDVRVYSEICRIVNNASIETYQILLDQYYNANS